MARPSHVLSIPLQRRGMLRALGVAACATVASPGRWARPAPNRVRVALEREGSLAHLPLIVAQRLGYFRQEGLDVVLIELAGAAAVFEAVQAGRAEAGSGPYLGVLQRQLRGEAVQTIVLQGRVPQVALGVSVRLLPAYRGPGDLRGRRICVPAPGTMGHVLARLWLAREAVAPDEVEWVSLAPVNSAVLALRSGEVDALSHLEPGMTQLEQKGELRTIADARTLKGAQQVFGGPLPGTCLFVPQASVTRQGAACQALVNGVARALAWLQTAQPQDIISTVPEASMMGDRALYLASFYRLRESYSPDGLLGEAGGRTAWNVVTLLGEGREARAEEVLARSYTNEFAERARTRLSKT